MLYLSHWLLVHIMISSSKTTVAVNNATQVEKQTEDVQIKPDLEICLSDLKLVLGPELKIVYPLILNFAVSGELELNGLAHPKWIKPRGILAFENGEVDLVATQVCVMFYSVTFVNCILWFLLS